MLGRKLISMVNEELLSGCESHVRRYGAAGKLTERLSPGNLSHRYYLRINAFQQVMISHKFSSLLRFTP